MKAADYLRKTGDVDGARAIAALYCVDHRDECENTAMWLGFERSALKEALELGALGEGGVFAGATAESEAAEAGAARPGGLGGCNSFVAGTPVLMADGGTKPIEQVEVGDQIENAEPGGTSVDRHVVTAVHVTDDDRDFVDITVLTSDGLKNIATTAHHPFWNATNHAWSDAADLEVGDLLATPGDGRVAVRAVRRYSGGDRTYNLTVEIVHTYYVMAGTTPVLVHNCTPTAANGASLENISGSDAAKIQAAADRIGRPVHLVDSRASGTAGPESDWDYVVTGANSKIKDKIKWIAPPVFGRARVRDWISLLALSTRICRTSPSIRKGNADADDRS